jgi:hypothetical protein
MCFNFNDSIYDSCFLFFNLKSILLSFSFTVVIDGSTLWHLYRFLRRTKYIYTWIHLLNPSPSSLPTRIPGVDSTGIILAFTYMCTHFNALCSPSHCPSLTLAISPLPLVPTLTLGKSCSTILFSNFVGEKWEKIKKRSTTF